MNESTLISKITVKGHGNIYVGKQKINERNNYTS